MFAVTAGLLSVITDPGRADAPPPEMDGPGQILVQAGSRWNDTGMDLHSGLRYRFTIKGQWKDAGIRSTARGYRSDDHQISSYMRPVFRLAERWRRMPTANWFSLICTIGRNPEHWINIGGKMALNTDQVDITAPVSGRLYCTANDLPLMYFNNSGQLTLTIEPLSH